MPTDPRLRIPLEHLTRKNRALAISEKRFGLRRDAGRRFIRQKLPSFALLLDRLRLGAELLHHALFAWPRPRDPLRGLPPNQIGARS